MADMADMDFRNAYCAGHYNALRAKLAPPIGQPGEEGKAAGAWWLGTSARLAFAVMATVIVWALCPRSGAGALDQMAGPWHLVYDDDGTCLRATFNANGSAEFVVPHSAIPRPAFWHLHHCYVSGKIPNVLDSPVSLGVEATKRMCEEHRHGCGGFTYRTESGKPEEVGQPLKYEMFLKGSFQCSGESDEAFKDWTSWQKVDKLNPSLNELNVLTVLHPVSRPRNVFGRADVLGYTNKGGSMTLDGASTVQSATLTLPEEWYGANAHAELFLDTSGLLTYREYANGKTRVATGLKTSSGAKATSAAVR